MALTSGALEAEISKRIVQFHKDHLGRGPREVRTHLFEDVVFVRLWGVLTRAEERLAGAAEGDRLIKEMRRHLLDNSRDELVSLVAKQTACRVVNVYTDLSTDSGEEILVFTLEHKL